MSVIIGAEYVTLDSKCFDRYKDYHAERLDDEEVEILERNTRISRGDILMMTTVAGSGHPGGSMSTIDLATAVYTFSRNTYETLDDPKRDRIHLSHAHVAPALYSLFGRNNYFSTELFPSLRVLGSIMQGHIDKRTPGVERGFGGLGQGLSAGLADAVACKLKLLKYNTFVLMSDGEQTKGQVNEARQAAKKFYEEGKLGKLIGIIDRNHLQISGRTEEVMDVDIKAEYETKGWRVIEVNGHNFKDLYGALKKSTETDKPSVIIAETIMGRGVEFMENDKQWHGKVLPVEMCKKALRELCIEDKLDWYFEKKREYEENVFRR